MNKEQDSNSIMLRLTQASLAKMAELGVSTVADFELERREVSADAMNRMRKALEASGAEFTNGKRPGVRLNR
jgi:transcriptional regulator with XRE-family HTH domain